MKNFHNCRFVYFEKYKIHRSITRFDKYLKTLKLADTDSHHTQQTLDELHKSFASLTQEEQKFANVQILKAPKNAGNGNAVHRGMLAARGRYILFADADNSTTIEEISKLLTKVQQEGYDIAVGSRAATGAEEGHKSFLRHLLSWGLRWIVHTLFRIGVRDTQCGFKMYTREAAHRLHHAQTIMGFSFDLEILYLASKWGYRIAEVPVTWIDAPGSKVDTSKEVRRFVRDLFLIKWNDLRGVYAKS